MEKQEVIETQDDTVACDGGSISGHPKVYLSIDIDDGYVICPYCSRCYALSNKPEDLEER